MLCNVNAFTSASVYSNKQIASERRR